MVLHSFRPRTAITKRFVRSSSSRLTPLKHNMTTIKWLPSTLKNWTHFPKFLWAPLSDQDRAAQVASFSRVAPNICVSSVHISLTPHTLRRLPEILKNYKTLVYVILHFTHKFTLQNKWHKNFEHYCICNGIMNLLLRQHENTSVADKTNNPKQFLRTAEFEAQLLLHCSFIKCDKTFNMVSEVLHSCDLLSTEYHIIPVMSEV